VDWLSRLGRALSCHPWALVSVDEAVSPGDGALGPQETLLLDAFGRLNASERKAVLTLVAAAARQLDDGSHL